MVFAFRDLLSWAQRVKQPVPPEVLRMQVVLFRFVVAVIEIRDRMSPSVTGRVPYSASTLGFST